MKRDDSGFEIWFWVIWEPRDERAYWLRYTTFRAKGASEKKGIVWATSFDSKRHPCVQAEKAFFPVTNDSASETMFIRLGENELGASGCLGEVTSMAWDFHYELPSHKPRHLSRLVELLPARTQSEILGDSIEVNGEIAVAGVSHTLQGARGVLMHIWGKRRVDELLWIYAPKLASNTATLEFVAVRPAMQRFSRLGWVRGLRREIQPKPLDHTGFVTGQRMSVTRPNETTLHIEDNGFRQRIIVRATAPRDSFAGFVYRDPIEGERYVAQSDLASTTVETYVRSGPWAPWRPHEESRVCRRAALEFHGLRPDNYVRYLRWEEGVGSDGIECAAMVQAPESEDRVELPRIDNVFALGLTYRAHIRETGGTDRGDPLVFRKNISPSRHPSTLIVPTRRALLDAVAGLDSALASELSRRYAFLPAMLDYEGEIALVVLEPLAGTHTMSPVAFAVANDVTARSIQVLGEGQADSLAYWSASKSFPSFLPMSSTGYRPPASAWKQWPAVTLRTTINGQSRQCATTDQLTISVEAALHFAATFAGRPLRRGDVVLTGTPSGVAMSVSRIQRAIARRFLNRNQRLAAALSKHATSPNFLRLGDRVRVDGGVLGAIESVVSLPRPR